MTEFWRLSGAGNDFLALVGPAELPDPETVRAWCRRGVSLGADGILVLRRRDAGADLRYANADGGEASLCLNGARCAVRLAHELGWTTGGRIGIRFAGRDLPGRVVDEETAEIEAPLPDSPPRTLRLRPGDAPIDARLVTVGVPHLVVVVDSPLGELPVESLGPALRSDPGLGPGGANVDFVRFTGVDELEIRSWERGVEAETLACGTGVLAAVATGLEGSRLRLPATARTRGGFSLTVAGELDETGRSPVRWHLAGDARIVATGTILPGAGISLPC